MVDLKTQYHKIKTEIDAALIEVLESSAFINGKPVQEFADNLAKYLNVKHVIPCANGTDALQIAMMALNLQPGDEVITPSFTYIATTEVVALLRLKPVFVEVDAKTFCMDAKALRKAITPKTKAIVPVHLYGQAANMEAIMEIARDHNLFVIEDNAQAIGCDYYFKDGGKKKTEATVLNIKLRELDDYIAARRKVADYYDNAFANNPKIIEPFRAEYCSHVFHQYTLILEDINRNGLHEYLASKNIPSMIYYPVPGHRQKMFGSFTSNEYHLPVTDWLTERVISLPIHTELDEEQLSNITQSVLEYVNA